MSSASKWIRQIAGTVIRLLAVILVSFLLFHFSEADPARLRLGATASESQVNALRKEMLLDQPFLGQVSHYVGGVLKGNLGTSWRDGTPIAPLVVRKIARTLSIALLALIPVLPLTYGLARLAFIHPTIEDPLTTAVRWLAALPSFLITVGGLMLGVLLGIPILSSASWLPPVLLSCSPLAAMTLLLLQAMSSQRSPSVRAAVASGLPSSLVFHTAVFRPAAPAWITAWINHLAMAVFVAMTLEIILTIDGCGSLLFSAIQNRDLPVLRGILLVNSVIFLVLQAVSRMLAVRSDPRLASLPAS